MRQFRYLLLLGLFVLATPLSATAPPELEPGYPESYVVQSGDTLWDIANRYLREPWRWPDIWHLNPEIGNPHLIYPGDVLRMTFENGQPRLAVAPRSGAPREVKLSPHVRREALTRAIPTIPIDTIQQFLTRPQVLSKQELDQAARLTAFVQEHIVGGSGDLIYVSSVEDDLVRGFDVIRPGPAYRDPDSGEYLGQEALFVGTAQLLRAGTPAKMLLSATTMEAELGDRVIPNPEEEYLENFQPKPGPPFLEGKILSVLGGVNQIGVHSVVALSKGADGGLEPGHVMQILRRSVPPRKETDTVLWQRKTELPLEEVGVLMVFRTFERVSYGLVMSASGTIQVLDTVRSPES